MEAANLDILYLNNSGFAIRQERDLLILDCFDPAAQRKKLGPLMDAARRVTVLVSHRHRDHYSPDIFQWSKSGKVQYLLSYDVETRQQAAAIRPGQWTRINDMQITAYGSTDEGVSFHILWNGVSLFHAGDLNYWHWQDESTPEEIAQAQEEFSEELLLIRRGVKQIDYAFFPVDPRMGTDYWRGAIQFVQTMQPKVLIPMHFGAKFAPPQDFYDQMKAVGGTLWTSGLPM